MDFIWINPFIAEVIAYLISPGVIKHGVLENPPFTHDFPDSQQPVSHV